MRIVQTAAEISLAENAGGVFVPTMGALHAGHAALVTEAAERKRRERIAGPVVVSIFVNPTQFNDRSDLARYPRTLGADVEMCERAGAEVVFAPDEQTIYPPGRTIATPRLPAVATEPGLEDAFRPGHFAGVCQVVARLFELVNPAAAVFGEKDWQQLQVIRAMVARERGERDVGEERPRIIGLATVREADGLAMSSRNRFLSAGDRRRAGAVPRALREGGLCGSPAEAERAMRLILEGEGGMSVDYAVVRDAASLMPADRPGAPLRSLIAARLGSVRLIDNAAWPAG